MHFYKLIRFLQPSIRSDSTTVLVAVHFVGDLPFPLLSSKLQGMTNFSELFRLTELEDAPKTNRRQSVANFQLLKD